MGEEYIIKETSENVWEIMDENGSIIRAITKENIVNYCKKELEDNRTECLSADGIIDSVWWEINDDYDLELVDNYCQDWDKFTAWFDYVVVEYLAQEIVSLYKQRLRNWE